MAVHCNICSGDFHNSSDSVVLCNFKNGPVHMGCCVNNCSWDKKPCVNAEASYAKSI